MAANSRAIELQLSATRRVTNVAMLSLTAVCTLVSTGALLFILGYLLAHGIRALNWDFFTKLPLPPGEIGGGIANAIVGSGKVLLIATLVGVPIGFLGGTYLSEYSGRTFAFIVRYMTDLLNGVPSIVIGIFAYTLFVLPVKSFTALAGGLALGIMMIPIAVRSTEEFLQAVPMSLREGAMALGASKSHTILTVVIPAAMRGIMSGIMLDLARVAGETAPLLFTALFNQYWSPGWRQPIATLPVLIFNYAISPSDDWHEKAWGAGFILLTLVFVVNILARLVVSRGFSHSER